MSGGIDAAPWTASPAARGDLRRAYRLSWGARSQVRPMRIGVIGAGSLGGTALPPADESQRVQRDLAAARIRHAAAAA